MISPTVTTRHNGLSSFSCAASTCGSRVSQRTRGPAQSRQRPSTWGVGELAMNRKIWAYAGPDAYTTRDRRRHPDVAAFEPTSMASPMPEAPSSSSLSRGLEGPPSEVPDATSTSIASVRPAWSDLPRGSRLPTRSWVRGRAPGCLGPSVASASWETDPVGTNLSFTLHQGGEACGGACVPTV